MGQDELGHARRLYQHLVDSPGAVEQLVYERPADQFRAAPVARSYPRAWEGLLARQLVYELADEARLDVLAGSTSPAVADLAAEMRHEEQYHLDFWLTWIRSTTAVSPHASELTQQALTDVWPAGRDVLLAADDPATEEALGVPVGSFAQATRSYTERLKGVVQSAGLHLPTGNGGEPRDALDEMLDEMRSVYQTAPGSW
jgi:ring-1,2-phenylacetyl-CoA epoxidase subunit PaaC